jgi:tetratricopeptide (TPR) repeat protein
MFKKSFFKQLFVCTSLLLALSLSAVFAQDSAADIQYKEDYDLLQRIVAVSQPVKRAGQIVALYKDRSDLDPRLQNYADNYLLRDLESLTKQGNYTAVIDLCERAVSARKLLGEVYLFYGVALKHMQKNAEAMKALAKCYVIKNSFQQRAKQQLDIIYRASNKGSIVGQDKLINSARKEVQ